MLLSHLFFGIFGIVFGLHVHSIPHSFVNRIEFHGSLNDILMHFIRNQRINSAQALVSQHGSLLERFNPVHFMALLNTFDSHNYSNNLIFWELFELLKPSYLISHNSGTTPLICAIQLDNRAVFSALLEIPGISELVDQVDETFQSALDYSINPKAVAKGDAYYFFELIRVTNRTPFGYLCEFMAKLIRISSSNTKQLLLSESNRESMTINGTESFICKLNKILRSDIINLIDSRDALIVAFTLLMMAASQYSLDISHSYVLVVFLFIVFYSLADTISGLFRQV
jgi:hypothetical protein